MNIRYRDYKSEDKELYLSLRKKLKVYQKSIDPIHRVKNLSGYAEMDLEANLKDIAKYQGRIIFAEDDSKTVGFVNGVIWEQSEINKLEIGPHKLGEVGSLFIEEDYRGKGIGRNMLQIMEDYFKEKGCDSMWISVFAPNTTARNLYERFGFIDREMGMLKEI